MSRCSLLTLPGVLQVNSACLRAGMGATAGTVHTRPEHYRFSLSENSDHPKLTPRQPKPKPVIWFGHSLSCLQLCHHVCHGHKGSAVLRICWRRYGHQSFCQRYSHFGCSTVIVE